MKTIELFIGANNKTGRVERELLIKTLSKYHEGFTIQPSVGYWMGAREESVVVTIADDEQAIRDTAQRLKQVLKQDAIAMHEVAPLEFV